MPLPPRVQRFRDLVAKYEKEGRRRMLDFTLLYCRQQPDQTLTVAQVAALIEAETTLKGTP